MTRISGFLLLALAGSAAGRAQDSDGEVHILAFGDVNLGREVGQYIFKGDTLYPFSRIADTLRSADIVFANLEGPLTDQGGETRHPTDGYKFCGPPVGAWSLLAAGVDVVSTSNNHAYDYGRRGLFETAEALSRAGIAWTGTSVDSSFETSPAVIERRGIRFGFLAFTEFVNVKGPWFGHIALFNEARARSEIDRLRERADVVIVSYHGGAEYASQPSKGSIRNMRALASAGADVVLGHHPHVPQGVDTTGGALIFPSLGNFVFHQPQRFWTRVGLAASLRFSRSPDSSVAAKWQLLALSAGNRPAFSLSPRMLDSLEARFEDNSSVRLKRNGHSFSPM